MEIKSISHTYRFHSILYSTSNPRPYQDGSTIDCSQKVYSLPTHPILYPPWHFNHPKPPQHGKNTADSEYLAYRFWAGENFPSAPALCETPTSQNFWSTSCLSLGHCILTFRVPDPEYISTCQKTRSKYFAKSPRGRIGSPMHSFSFFGRANLLFREHLSSMDKCSWTISFP